MECNCRDLVRHFRFQQERYSPGYYGVGHRHGVLAVGSVAVDAGATGVVISDGAVGELLREVDDLAGLDLVDVADAGVAGQHGFGKFIEREVVAGIPLQQPDVGDGAACADGGAVAARAVRGDIAGAVPGRGAEVGGRDDRVLRQRLSGVGLELLNA